MEEIENLTPCRVLGGKSCQSGFYRH